MEIHFDVSRAFAKLSPNAARATFQAVGAEARAWATDEQAAFIEQRLSGRPGLNRWSGRLTRSLVPIREASPDGMRAGFMFLPTMQGEGGAVPNYAGIHEAGGTIRPKNGRMLAWPVAGGPAQTQGGANRYGSSPRNYPGKLFFFQSKTGHKFLAESFGRGGNKLRLVYHLANSVEIPARLGFAEFGRGALMRGKDRLNMALITHLQTRAAA